MRRFLLLAVALASCDAAPATARPRAEITYRMSRCFGTCPAYAVTIGNAGQPGVFESEAFTAVEGRRTFAVSPAQFDAFEAALAALRREEAGAFEPGGRLCPSSAIEGPTVEVTWRQVGAIAVTRRFYFGCDRNSAAIAARLRHAPALLPIAAFVGAD